jgi:hypothetical protein
MYNNGIKFPVCVSDDCVQYKRGNETFCKNFEEQYVITVKWPVIGRAKVTLTYQSVFHQTLIDS